MIIKIKNGVDPYKIQDEIVRRISDRFTVSKDSTAGFVTRPGFTAEYQPNGRIYTGFLHVNAVRLIEKKDYCGNHPNECEVRFGGGAGRGRRANFLEGVDWVDFNDRLNDACDALYVDAIIESTTHIIRRGTMRRINYDSYMRIGGFFYQWDKKGDDCDFEDHCGHAAPASDYPWGTPGEYLRKVEW